MSEKELFRKFCEQEKDIPIFLTYGWLQTVAPDCWDVVMECRGGEIVAFMPYVIKRKLFFKYITIPPLTPYMGPWIKYPKGQKYTTRLSHEKEMMTLLVSKLPVVDYFIQTFSPAITNWLPFYWASFQQSTRYTYVLTDVSNLDHIKENFSKNVRRHLKRAEEHLTVIEIEDVTILYNTLVKFYQENSLDMHFTLDYLTKIYSWTRLNNIGKLLAVTENENIIAAHLYVYDGETIYNLVGATDPDYKNSGAMTLLIWEGIKVAYEKGLKSFDFEGSMVMPVEKYFRDFGGIQRPYFKVTKSNSKLLTMYFYLKSTFKK
ncbi:MAG TPA: GNAT family N-acetyltransferase [Cytophagaceae bacterium]|jgi:hypothetical protein